MMPQKCNQFCHRVWTFSNQLSTQTWPDREPGMLFSDLAVQKDSKSVIKI